MPSSNNESNRESGKSALTPVASMQDDMQRMFHDFLGDFGITGLRPFAASAPVKAPRMDVAESETAYVITAEVPGVEEKDIEVKVSEGVVTVRGEKRAEKEEKNKNYHRVERSYGMFERALALPPNVNAEKIAADLSKGVLTITVPKLQTKTPATKTIAVKSKG